MILPTPLCFRFMWQKSWWQVYAYWNPWDFSLGKCCRGCLALQCQVFIFLTLWVELFVSWFWIKQHIKDGSKKALQISRTKLRGAGTTCGGRVRDRRHKSFVSAKAQSTKDHQRQRLMWAKSYVITQVHEEGYPKGNICCCPRGKRNASFVKIGFLMKEGFWEGSHFCTGCYFWGRIRRSSH